MQKKPEARTHTEKLSMGVQLQTQDPGTTNRNPGHPRRKNQKPEPTRKNWVWASNSNPRPGYQSAVFFHGVLQVKPAPEIGVPPGRTNYHLRLVVDVYGAEC